MREVGCALKRGFSRLSPLTSLIFALRALVNLTPYCLHGDRLLNMCLLLPDPAALSLDWHVSLTKATARALQCSPVCLLQRMFPNSRGNASITSVTVSEIAD